MSVEQLRDQSFAAPGLDTQSRLAVQLQQRAFGTVPDIPLGRYVQATAYRTTPKDVLSGFSIFWNVRKGA